jgi:hypothetical protein
MISNKRYAINYFSKCKDNFLTNLIIECFLPKVIQNEEYVSTERVLGCVICLFMSLICSASFSSGYLAYKDHWEIFFYLWKILFNPPQEGYSVK